MAKKKQNAFVSYFVPFGIKQLCDILMFVASVLLIVGLSLYEKVPVLIVVGLGMFILAAVLLLIKKLTVVFGGVNHRAPEYKNAIANIVISVIILALAVVGMIFYFM